MAALIDGVFALWGELGLVTKVGLLAQGAAIGLLLAAIRRPSRPVLVAALFACALGLIGISGEAIFMIEYARCGDLEAPSWCEP